MVCPTKTSAREGFNIIQSALLRVHPIIKDEESKMFFSIIVVANGTSSYLSTKEWVSVGCLTKSDLCDQAKRPSKLDIFSKPPVKRLQ